MLSPFAENIVQVNADVGGFSMTPIIVTGTQTIDGHNGDIFVLVGQGAFLGLSNNSLSFIVALGHGQSVSLFPPGDTQETIVDLGQVTSIFVPDRSSLTIFDFGHDKTGHITLRNGGFRDAAAAVPSEVPDGHGGIIISSSVASVDFIGVRHVDASAHSFFNFSTDKAGQLRWATEGAVGPSSGPDGWWCQVDDQGTSAHHTE